MDDELDYLVKRGRQFINDEFRCVYSNDDAKENDIPCSQPINNTKNIHKPVQSIQDARKKLRQEWEALKNSTISPVNDNVTEKVKEIRIRDSQKETLYGVVAYVEVNNDKQKSSIGYMLKKLGVTVKDKFSIEVTHVVFKNGSLETYKRAKLLNVHLVSTLWVNACRNSDTKVCERLFPVTDTNDYSNSPRVFRRFMEYQSKFYEFDETTGGLIRKSSKNQQSSLINSLQNLNLENVNNKPQSNQLASDVSSSERLTLFLSDESNKSDTSNDNGHQIQVDVVCEVDTRIGKENTLTKRKLYSKRPLEENYNTSSDVDSLSQKTSQRPVLVNPYKKEITKSKTLTKKTTQPNKILVKATYVSPPKKQKVCKDNNYNPIISQMDTCQGIKEFHQVYQRTHQVFRPPSKYNNTDHGRCPSLVSTSLHSDENRNLKQIISQLGGFHFKAKVDKTTTHVVCGEPRRTINILKALAHGCWILSLDWVKKSAEAGQWLNETQFEVVGFSKMVQKCRLQKQTFRDSYSLNIFDDCGSIFVSDKCSPPRKDLMELIVLCGGKVTSNLSVAKIVVGDTISSCGHCVTEKWVLDSIMIGRYKTLQRYYL